MKQLVLGNAAMLDGMIDRASEEMGEEKVTVIATGGLAKSIAPYCKREVIVGDNLLLEGLRILYEKNCK